MTQTYVFLCVHEPAKKTTLPRIKSMVHREKDLEEARARAADILREDASVMHVAVLNAIANQIYIVIDRSAEGWTLPASPLSEGIWH